MKDTVLLLCAATVFAIGTSSAPAQVIGYDDGTAETSFGFGLPPGNSASIWMNAFPSTVPTSVVALQVIFGSPNFPGGNVALTTPITFAVWSDPNNDGNPTDAILLATGSGTVTSTDTNTYVTYTFPTQVDVSGGVFVGYSIDASAPFPQGYDQDNPTVGTSWAYGGSDLAVLSNNSGPFDLNTVFPGVATIRLVAVPEPATYLSGITALVLLGAQCLRRQRQT